MGGTIFGAENVSECKQAYDVTGGIRAAGPVLLRTGPFFSHQTWTRNWKTASSAKGTQRKNRPCIRGGFFSAGEVPFELDAELELRKDGDHVSESIYES